MSWTAPAMFNALAQRFSDWEDLSGVDIYTAPLEKPPTAGDAIVFLTAPGSQEWASLGAQARYDEYRIECVLFCINNGLGETSAVAARDRAGEIMSAVAECLLSLTQTDLGTLATELEVTQVLPFRLARFSIETQTAESSRRICSVNFDIDVKVKV